MEDVHQVEAVAHVLLLGGHRLVLALWHPRADGDVRQLQVGVLDVGDGRVGLALQVVGEGDPGLQGEEGAAEDGRGRGGGPLQAVAGKKHVALRVLLHEN